MKKTSIYLLFLLSALFVCGCSDEPDFSSLNGNLEEVDGTRISIFHLRDQNSSLKEKCENVKFTLVDPSGQNSLEFQGSIVSGEENGHKVITCRLNIGNTSIPNGIYFISLDGEELPEIGLRKVRFTNNIGSEDETALFDYTDLEGAGTETDPYIISSDGDFLIMLSYLIDDPNHGYGRYFLQTRSFELPRRSQVIDGKMWAAVTFSGNYDGGGHRLRNLIYQGASDSASDSGIGLFKELFSARISNVSINGALLSNVVSDAGIIAGRAMGNCCLENITVEGSIIASGNNLGGLIGYAKGDASFKNITLNSLTISNTQSAGSCMGLIVGLMDNGNLVIDGINTPDHVFSVTGKSDIGGLVGKVDVASKNVTISNAMLQHSVDSESATTKIISGDTNIGGLVGSLRGVNELRLSNNQIKVPVSGNERIGGLIGNIDYISQGIVEKCVLTSVVSGEKSIGGFFGATTLASKGKLEFSGSDNGSRLVLKSSAEAEVSGIKEIGGLFGSIEGENGQIIFSSKVEIAINVKGESQIGGAIGYAHNIDISKADNLNFSSTTMKVTASKDCAGGVLGYGMNVSLSGQMTLDPVKSLPSRSDLPMTFSGVVNAPEEAACIVGVLEGGTVKGLASNGKATSQHWAGGIVARVTGGKVTECAFNGTASSPNVVGGVVSYANKEDFSISKCINYANLVDANYLGGVMGQYEQCGKRPTGEERRVMIEECFNWGDLQGGLDVGGIVARIDYRQEANYAGTEILDNPTVQILNSGNRARVIGNDNSGSYSVGGIAGTLNSNIVKVKGCANTGSVHSYGVQKTVGGVVGHAGCDGSEVVYIEECANSGVVSCDAYSVKIGGVVGHQETSLGHGGFSYAFNCINDGLVEGDHKDDTGGIMGYAAHEVTLLCNWNVGIVEHGNAILGTHNSGTQIYHDNNYYLKGTGGGWPSAIMVTADQTRNESTFKEFDFKKVWEMTDKYGPVLRNCPFQRSRWE